MFNRHNDFYLREKINNDNVVFVNADSVLFTPTKSDDYYKRKYGHWRLHKEESIFVDGHPNLECHEIISEAVFNGLKAKKIWNF